MLGLWSLSPNHSGDQLQLSKSAASIYASFQQNKWFSSSLYFTQIQPWGQQARAFIHEVSCCCLLF